MDALLGNYGSDEDEEIVNDSSKLPAPTAVPSPPPKSNSSAKQPQLPSQSKTVSSQIVNVPGQKKRKLLDISILPDHIQKALIHGETSLGDSDDDEFAPTTQSKSHSTAKGGAKSSTGKVNSVKEQLDPLLAMLPAPTNKEDALDSMFSASKTVVKAASSVPQQDFSPSSIEIGELGGSVGIDDSFIGSGPPLLTRQFTSEPDSKTYTPQFPAAAYEDSSNQRDHSSHQSSDVHVAGESQRK